MGGIQPSNPQSKHALCSSHYNFKHISISQQYKWSEGKINLAARSAAPRDALYRTNRHEWVSGANRIHPSFFFRTDLAQAVKWNGMNCTLSPITWTSGLAPGFVFLLWYTREQEVQKRAGSSLKDWSANTEACPLSTYTYQMRYLIINQLTHIHKISH